MTRNINLVHAYVILDRGMGFDGFADKVDYVVASNMFSLFPELIRLKDDDEIYLLGIE